MKVGWRTVKLGDVCEITKGRKPKLKSAQANSDDLPYLVAKVMRGSEKAKYASAEDKNSILVKKNETIIICDGSNSGEVFTGFHGILSSTMGKLSKKGEVDDDYLREFLTFTFDIFNNAKTGVAIPHLDKDAMYRLELPLPQLFEQRQIVIALNEVTAWTANAAQNIKKNLQNIGIFFDSYLQSIFFDSENEWKERRLSEIAFIKGGKRVPKGHKLQALKTNHPYITVSDFNGSGGIEPKKIRYLDEVTFHQIKNYTISSADLYISIAGTIGKTGIVPEELDGANLTENACKLIFNHGIDNKFVYYFTRTSNFMQQATIQTRTAAQPKLSLERLKTIVLPVPNYLEQQRIVAQLDALSVETRRLEAIYRQKLAHLLALKQSILQKAFAGELRTDSLAA